MKEPDSVNWVCVWFGAGCHVDIVSLVLGWGLCSCFYRWGDRNLVRSGIPGLYVYHKTRMPTVLLTGQPERILPSVICTPYRHHRRDQMTRCWKALQKQVQYKSQDAFVYLFTPVLVYWEQEKPLPFPPGLISTSLSILLQPGWLAGVELSRLPMWSRWLDCSSMLQLSPSCLLKYEPNCPNNPSIKAGRCRTLQASLGDCYRLLS